ncbi:MAG TPA: hypothetical protein VIT91_06710, partial [Chthoniobacterales bacterium]
DYSVSCGKVDWSRYDVVISINFSIPSRIVQTHPNILWCYMIGEANMLCDCAYYGYDVCLNQEARGIVSDLPGVVDFPYTFVGPDCLEKIVQRTVGRASAQHGIFVEINSFQERPTKNVARLAPLQNTGHPLRLHKQSIRENLAELFDAKYFIKAGGRKIRGNSVLEAISCGTLVLMSPADLHHSQMLPKYLIP